VDIYVSKTENGKEMARKGSDMVEKLRSSWKMHNRILSLRSVKLILGFI
jgi:hypothetical protein